MTITTTTKYCLRVDYPSGLSEHTILRDSILEMKQDLAWLRDMGWLKDGIVVTPQRYMSIFKETYDDITIMKEDLR